MSFKRNVPNSCKIFETGFFMKISSCQNYDNILKTLSQKTVLVKYRSLMAYGVMVYSTYFS